MTLSERNRSRVLWTLVALAAVYGIITVLVYELEGTFGTAWFAASLVVYGSLLVAGVAMALLDPGRELERPAQETVASEAGAQPSLEPATAQDPGFELVSQETLYETPTGRVVRARFRMGEEAHEELFAISQDEVMPVAELEDLLDEAELSAQAQEIEGEVDQATDKRAHREPVQVAPVTTSRGGNGRQADDPDPTER